MYPYKVYDGNGARVVEISSRAKKDLERVPFHIVAKLNTWIGAVRRDGLENVRKVPGYHDEPLRGQRRGQRSIRLNRAYRAIYVILEGDVRVARIEEVTKHVY